MKTKSTFLFTVILSFLLVIQQSCKKENQIPTCEIASPVNGQEIISGETATIKVIAADSDGNIDEVHFFIDGNSKGSLTNPPFIYNWNTESESIGMHTLKVRCFDNNDGIVSDEITLEIIETIDDNTPPTAFYTITSSSGTVNTIFSLDASGCTDKEDDTSDLQVIWDFDGDFGWDTGWDVNKTVSHQYESEGTYTIRMEVKDTNGKTDFYTRSISVVYVTMTDPRDGQNYDIVTIGNQTWFAENLNYETSDSWWYENDIENGEIYGRLYAWDDALTVCPSGWHLPSDEEWKVLEKYLGMSQIEVDKSGWRGTDEGQKLKSDTGWNIDINGTNSSRFNALPGGVHTNIGEFESIGNLGSWWSSTEISNAYAWNRHLTYGEIQVHRYQSAFKSNGYSVRCLKN